MKIKKWVEKLCPSWEKSSVRIKHCNKFLRLKASIVPIGTKPSLLPLNTVKYVLFIWLLFGHVSMWKFRRPGYLGPKNLEGKHCLQRVHELQCLVQHSVSLDGGVEQLKFVLKCGFFFLKHFIYLFIYLTPKTFCIGVYPINNIVVVSGEHRRNSDIHIHVSILPQTPHSQPGWYITLTGVPFAIQ